MLIYNVLMLLIVLLGISLYEVKKFKWSDVIFLTTVSVAMVVIASLRAETVGIDYKMYAAYFQQVHDGGWSFLISSANGYRIEPGYSLLNYIVSLFTPDVRVFMAVVSILVTVLTAVLVYKNSPIVWVGMFAFVAFGSYGNSLSFIRQSIAISIFLFAIRYLKEKRFVPYLLILLLAATFHKSILIMLPIYFVAHIRVSWKSLTTYCVGTGVIMGLSWPIIKFITQFAFKYYTTSEGLYYVIIGRDWNTAVIPVAAALTALLLKNMLLKRNPANIVLINFSIYSGLLYIMTCQRFLFQRFGMMFFASIILLVPEILKSIGVNEETTEKLAELKKDYKAQSGMKKKKALQESRKLKSSLNYRKYTYRYAVAAVLFFGVLYQEWMLLANRINLIPYLTFFN